MKASPLRGGTRRGFAVERQSCCAPLRVIASGVMPTAAHSTAQGVHMEELRKIRAAIAAGITKSDLAERSGVARRVLDSLDDEAFNPTLETLKNLAAAASSLAAERIEALKKVA